MSHVHNHDHSTTDAYDPAQVIDPVCGMTVDPAKAKGPSVHDGKPYYFCGSGCLTKFEAEPDRYMQEETNGESSESGSSDETLTQPQKMPCHPQGTILRTEIPARSRPQLLGWVTCERLAVSDPKAWHRDGLAEPS